MIGADGAEGIDIHCTGAGSGLGETLVATFCLLLAIIFVGAAVFTLVGVTFARGLVRRGLGEGHNEVSAAIFAVGGTIYAVFLAMLVVAAWEAHDAASANSASEASLLCTLYRASTDMEPQSGSQLRASIRGYTRAVIDDEWPLQAQPQGGAAETARRDGLQMLRVFGAMPPPARQADAVIDRTELDLITQIQSDRNERTLQSQEHMSPLIWWAAIVGGLLVVLMSFFLYPDRDWPHLVMSGILTAMVAMLLAVVWIFSSPFAGPMPLSPDVFRHSIEVYDSVDRTP
jgi:Protein of unknown function (DUF4239)